MRLKRRQPQEKWTPAEVVSDVKAAFYGDDSQLCVRAAVVVRYAYERLPRDVLRQWEADAVDEHDGRLPSYGVFEFDFHDDDRFMLYMEGDRSISIREVEVGFDLDEARAKALAWVGEPNTETHLENLPGMYAASLIEAVTGVERLWNEWAIEWFFPGDADAVYVPFRKYPTPLNEELAFHLMPKEVGAATFRQFLLSETVAEAIS